MTTLTSDAARQQQEQRAAWCDRQLSVDEALVASHQIEALEASSNEAVNICLDYYTDFGLWSAQVEKGWSEDPSLYEPKTHATIRMLRRTWFATFGKVVGILDDPRCSGLLIPRAEAARKCYSIMLSIERMDQAEVGDKLRQLADDAVAEYRADQAEK